MNIADQLALALGEDAAPRVPMFDGKTFDPVRDGMRLGAQMLRVWALMSDGKWRTLADIAVSTGDPQASVSARLRDLRKPRFGTHTVESEYLGRGLHRYRLLPGASKPTPLPAGLKVPKRAHKPPPAPAPVQEPLRFGPWPTV